MIIHLEGSFVCLTFITVNVYVSFICFSWGMYWPVRMNFTPNKREKKERYVENLFFKRIPC